MTYLLVIFIILQRLLELRHARRNEQAARALGAREYGREHYWLFFVLHPAWLVCLAWEGSQHSQPPQWWAVASYLALQWARYSIIRDLGIYWNTRILILPQGQRVRSGWFRYFKHPNYMVVALELLITPLIVHAFWTALIFTVLNALVMMIRIPAEERALAEYTQNPPNSNPTPLP